MKHLVLLLHAGDYRDASERRARGLPDRYRHHSYALESLGRLVSEGVAVTVVRMYSDEPYDVVGGEGVRFVGLGCGWGDDLAPRVALLVRDLAPTHVMLRSPSAEVLRVLLDSGVRCSLALADSFPAGWRHGRRYRELGTLLQRPRVEFVANHHLNSARQLVDVLGVPAGKVIAWDWPLDLLDLAASSARTLPGQGPLRLCFAGSITGPKGLWDLVGGVRDLRRRGVDATLEVAGSGDTEHLKGLLATHDLTKHVTHLGRVGGDEIIEMLQRSTFACVPSRHAYPEGLPLTLYEAMAAGTPIVASDHPMFSGVVEDGVTGFVFRAGRPRELASAVMRGWNNPELYESVSFAAARQYREIGLATLWGELVRRWVRDRSDDRAYLRHAALATARP